MKEFMKSYKYIIGLLAFVAVVSSCKKEDEDVFSQDATTRVEQTKSQLVQTLVSSEKGWVFNYYPNPKKYGAFTFLIQFKDNGVCDMRGDLFFESDGVTTSSYSTNASQGVVLNFDTYGLLTKLADPSLFLTGSGWEGENEFIYLRTSANQDTVYYKGKKYGFETFMYRNTQDWDTFFNGVNGMIKNFSTGNSALFFRELNYGGLGDTQVTFTGYNLAKRTLTAYYKAENADTLIYQTAKLIITDKGVEFAEPLVIKGHSFQNFPFNGEKFICSDEGGKGATFLNVNKPTFNFGDVTKKMLRGIFEDDNYVEQVDRYRLTSLPYDLQVKADALSSEIPDFQLYAIYPQKESLGTSYYFFAFGTDGTYLVPYIGAKLTLKKSTDRLDEVEFTIPRSGKISIVWAGEGSVYEQPSEEYSNRFIEFYKELFGNQSYIIIPSSDYKMFEFGNENSANYFGITIL